MRRHRPTLRQQGQILITALTASCLLWLVSCSSLPSQPETAPQPPSTQLPIPLGSAAAARPIRQFSAAETATITWADRALNQEPQATQRVSTAGRLPSDPVAQASQAARMDWYTMLALAQAAAITGDLRYGNALESYFSAWVTVYQPQAQPIDETHFHQIVLAYQTGGQYLSVPTRAKTMQLFRGMANVLFDSRRIQPGTDKNNWQSHRVKLGTALAFVLQDPALIEGSRTGFRRQIARNIDAEGMVLDFRERDALHYVTYSLEPLLTAALIARQHGEDWYGYKAANGASLGAALQWLAPYADGEKIHLEFQNTRIEFDRQRARAGVTGFSGVWDPAKAATCYQLAARLDARWIARAVRLGTAYPWLELAYPSALIAAAQASLPTRQPLTEPH